MFREYYAITKALLAREYIWFFPFFSWNFALFSANFWWIFVRISRQIPEKSDVCRFFTQICENKLENCRNFWNLWKLFNIIQYYSIVSLGARRRRSRPTGTATSPPTGRVAGRRRTGTRAGGTQRPRRSCSRSLPRTTSALFVPRGLRGTLRTRLSPV